MALGDEEQPCNLSKRKPGTVLSPETYTRVTTEPLCLSCSWEREYTASLLSAGTEPGSLVRKAAGARTNSVLHVLPVIAYNREYQVSSLCFFFCLAGGTMPLSRLG